MKKVRAEEEKKKNFLEAVAEYNAISVDKFISELHRQVDEHFDKSPQGIDYT